MATFWPLPIWGIFSIYLLREALLASPIISFCSLTTTTTLTSDQWEQGRNHGLTWFKFAYRTPGVTEGHQIPWYPFPGGQRAGTMIVLPAGWPAPLWQWERCPTLLSYSLLYFRSKFLLTNFHIIYFLCMTHSYPVATQTWTRSRPWHWKAFPAGWML